jgi:hypothetical protein
LDAQAQPDFHAPTASFRGDKLSTTVEPPLQDDLRS